MISFFKKNPLKKLLCPLLLLLALTQTDFIYAQLPALLKPTENKSHLHYTINGVKKAVKKNIDTRLSVLTKQFDSTEKQNRTVIEQPGKQPGTVMNQYRTVMEQAPEQILKAMQPYGYYRPIIKTEFININKGIVFTIIPGKVMKVTKINIVVDGPGKNEPFFIKAVTQFPLKTGGSLLIEKYNNGKQELLDIAMQHGYIKSQMLSSQVLINLENYTSEIHIHLDTGKRFYFGQLSFNKTPFNEDYLKRYAPFNIGEPFEPEKLTTLQDGLSASQQFKQIVVTPEYNNVSQDQNVPIFVKLNPQKSQSYTMGAGYGTDTGIRGTLGWNLLRVTPSGHKFQTQLQASQVQNSLQGQYIIPGLHPAEEEYAITGNVFDLNYPDSQSNAAQLSGAYRYHHGDWQKTYSINALYEHYIIGQDPSQNAFIVYPSANWRYRKADSVIFPKNGYSVSFTTQGSSEALASSVTFAQAELSAKWAKTIQPMHSRIFLRTDLGVTGIDNIDNLPPSLQFYAGGAQSVRGYSYQGLGPGKILAVGSAEWQQEIIKKWYLNFFYDAGNAFNDSPIELKRSVGTGVMWITPIGPVRLYAAKTLNDNPEGSIPWHVVFSMGPDL